MANAYRIRLCQFYRHKLIWWIIYDKGSCVILPETIRVAVIDTNVDLDHPALKGANIIINYAGGLISCSDDSAKGHGTAVSSIIFRENSSVEITVYPLFSTLEVEGSEPIIEVLEYIRDHEFYDVINMSIGATLCDNVERFEFVCRQLSERGMILVSAYNNAGIMSYPACFSDVIGVDISPVIKNITEFEFIEDSCINIRGCSKQQRLPWDTPRYVFASGTSFLAPYIAGKIVNLKNTGIKINNVRQALDELKKCASSVRKFGHVKAYHQLPAIQKAVVFPFNKEVHGIVKYSNMLNFELIGVYDLKYFMRIGKSVSSVLKQTLDRDFIIENIESIDWEGDFDTIIFGHLSEIERSAQYDVCTNIIRKACQHNKKIYTFDSYIDEKILKKRYEMCYYPIIEKAHVPYCLFGKMWMSRTPVVGVFGTRSKQGKFTTQLAIKRRLSELGYKVGQIASEPTGALLGADCVFPFGYGSTVETSHEESILVLNDMIHRIENKGVDLVLVGCQSGTISYDTHNISRILLGQISFLYGTLPDAVILCVSPDDELEYIRRTINFLESSTNCKVIAIAVYPIMAEPFLVSNLKQKNISGSELLMNLIEQFKKEFHIPVFEQHAETYDCIADTIIEFFC